MAPELAAEPPPDLARRVGPVGHVDGPAEERIGLVELSHDRHHRARHADRGRQLGAVAERFQQRQGPPEVDEDLVHAAHVQARHRQPRLEPPGFLVHAQLVEDREGAFLGIDDLGVRQPVFAGRGQIRPQLGSCDGVHLDGVGEAQRHPVPADRRSHLVYPGSPVAGGPRPPGQLALGLQQRLVRLPQLDEVTPAFGVMRRDQLRDLVAPVRRRPLDPGRHAGVLRRPVGLRQRFVRDVADQDVAEPELGSPENADGSRGTSSSLTPEPRRVSRRGVALLLAEARERPGQKIRPITAASCSDRLLVGRQARRAARRSAPAPNAGARRPRSAAASSQRSAGWPEGRRGR